MLILLRSQDFRILQNRYKFTTYHKCVWSCIDKFGLARFPQPMLPASLCFDQPQGKTLPALLIKTLQP